MQQHFNERAPNQSSSPVETSISAALVALFYGMGVREAYGIMGGAIAPFFRELAHGQIRCVHFRHEAGAAFAAIEASLATNRPVLVFTTAGPGISNAITGMLAARWEGAHVIFVSACTSAQHRGRVATQETTAETMPAIGLFLPGGPLHYAAALEHPAELGSIAAKLACGLQRKGGFVAHLSLPINMQNAKIESLPKLPLYAATKEGSSFAAASEHAIMLREKPFVIWLGYGARHAAKPIFELALRTGARVMCSPRAKGIFPEDHPQFLGVTGLGGHPEVDEYLSRERPEYTLVLGTRMGESTSFWSEELTPSRAFIHVDVEPTVFGASYPSVTTHAVVADIREYVTALLRVLPDGLIHAVPRIERRPQHWEHRASGPVRPQVLFQELQAVFVDRGDTWIMAESGNSFCWSSHLLRFREPGQYRVSSGFGSMGHATTGVVGAALARRSKAVAVCGDGAMTMLNEIHTAVQTGADAVWVVLNDACYLMCAQGMKTMGWEPFSCALPRIDFVAMARALGADGIRVEYERDVRAALEMAARARGPFVVDIDNDPIEMPPSGKRNKNLMQQGFDTPAQRSGDTE